MSDESQQNLIDVLSDLLSLCENENVDESVVVATAAVRNATNSSNLITKVKERFSLELKVLTGEEEAQLIGRGLLLDPSLDRCGFSRHLISVEVVWNLSSFKLMPPPLIKVCLSVHCPFPKAYL